MAAAAFGSITRLPILVAEDRAALTRFVTANASNEAEHRANFVAARAAVDAQMRRPRGRQRAGPRLPAAVGNLARSIPTWPSVAIPKPAAISMPPAPDGATRTRREA